jgi:hypothetical protein
MFRAAHRLSSGALAVFAASGLHSAITLMILYILNIVYIKILQWQSFYKELWLKGVVKINKDSNSQ